jgi:hypothetical protein
MKVRIEPGWKQSGFFISPKECRYFSGIFIFKTPWNVKVVGE